MNDILIGEKAQRQFEIMEEAKKQEKFLVAAMVKYLAFQLDAVGELRKPPSKSMAQCLLLAQTRLKDYVDEVYGLKKTHSTEGLIQNPSE